MLNIFSQYKGLKKEMYILFFGRVVTAMGSFIHPMLTLILKRKLNFDVTQITLILALSSILSLPASLIGGKLTDLIGRKKIIVVFDLITVSLYIKGYLALVCSVCCKYFLPVFQLWCFFFFKHAKIFYFI